MIDSKPTATKLLSPLRHRDFRLFWIGLLLSSIGSQFTTVAMAWQIYELTDSPLQIGLIGLVRAVPQVAVIAFESSADSKYYGISLELRKRFSYGWQANLSYTYGKAKDNKPDATAVVPGGSDDAKYAADPYLAGEWSWSDNDVRNRVVLAGLWDLDSVVGERDSGWERALIGGWQISGIITWQSGQPYSAVVLSDLNNDGNAGNHLAPGTTRNQYRLDDYFSVDPRITKTIRIAGDTDLQLILQCITTQIHNCYDGRPIK